MIRKIAFTCISLALIAFLASACTVTAKRGNGNHHHHKKTTKVVVVK